MNIRDLNIKGWELKAKSGFVMRGTDGARIAVSKTGSVEVHPEDAAKRVSDWLKRNRK